MYPIEYVERQNIIASPFIVREFRFDIKQTEYNNQTQSVGGSYFFGNFIHWFAITVSFQRLLSKHLSFRYIYKHSLGVKIILI